jgi:16S rRNA (adenine1518-N6/adenine1519-N6)-dimethyltransferase
MDLLEQTKYLIKQHHFAPNSLKGQNFCVDEKVLETMVKTADISQSDEVLEVGPGFGFLTAEILKKTSQVTAVELEACLVKMLQSLAELHSGLRVIHKDILRVEDVDLNLKNYKIVANLPYSVTSAFLKKFLNIMPKPASMTLLVQKEVAERICSIPGQMSLLAI